MRNVCIILIIMIFCCSISACSKGVEDYPWTLREPSISIYEGADFDLEIDKDTITEIGLTCYISNNTDEDSGFAASEYYLQIKVNNKWYDIVEERIFSDLEIALDAGEKQPQELNFGDYVGKLPKGDYRIIIPVGGKELLYIASEFSL